MKKLLKLANFLLLVVFLLNLGSFASFTDPKVAQKNHQNDQKFKKIALAEQYAEGNYRESLARQYQEAFVQNCRETYNSSEAMSDVKKFYLSTLVIVFFFLGLRKLSGKNDLAAKNWASIIIGAIVFPLTVAWLFILWSIRKVKEDSREARVRQRSENIFADINPQTALESENVKHAFVYALAVTIFLSALPSMAKVTGKSDGMKMKPAVAESYGEARAQIEHLQIDHLSPSGVDDDAGSSLVCIEHEKIEMKSFIVSVIIAPFEIVEHTLSRSRRIFHIPEEQN